jgi:hypothetical protein
MNTNSKSTKTVEKITYDQIVNYYYYYLNDEQDFIRNISFVALDQSGCKNTYSNEFYNIITYSCMDFEGLLRRYFQLPDDKEVKEKEYITLVDNDNALKYAAQEKVQVQRGNYKDLQPLELHENSKYNKIEWTKFWPADNRIKHHKLTGIYSATQSVAYKVRLSKDLKQESITMHHPDDSGIRHEGNCYIVIMADS